MEVTIFEQDVDCLEIDNKNCQIYFVRHALSKANKGNKNYVDTPLSPEGIEQAQQLQGHFDLVFCSPLRRTKETLHYSQITYDSLIIEHNIREMVQDKTSSLLLEDFKEEHIDNFWRRAGQFTKDLQHYCAKLSNEMDNKVQPKILIVSHGFFFNGWYRNGSFDPPVYADLIRLK